MGTQQWAYKAQAVQESNSLCDPVVFGANTLFLSLIPWVLSISIQEASIHAALIAGTVAGGVVVALGLLLYWCKARRCAVYFLDFLLAVVLAVCLGVSFAQEEVMARCFDFIINSTLGGLCLASIIVNHPITVQHIREAVPRDAWRHPQVMKAAYVTSFAWVAIFTVNTMLYLVPIAKGTWADRSSPYTIVFKVLVPNLLYFAGLIATRLAPRIVDNHLHDSQGFNSMAPPVYHV